MAFKVRLKFYGDLFVVRCIIYTAMFLILLGCSGTSSLVHEKSEQRLLSLEEFNRKVSLTADQIFQDMQSIHKAALAFAAANNGKLPSTVPGNTSAPTPIMPTMAPMPTSIPTVTMIWMG